MTREDEECNKGGGVSGGHLLVGSEIKGLHENGLAVAGENGVLGDVISSGSLGNELRTYKRRKRGKIMMEDGMAALGSTSQVSDQSMKEPCDKPLNGSSCSQPYPTQMESHSCVNNTNGCSLKQCRNVVLEQMSRMLECEGGLQGCIQDAVACHPGIPRATAIKESVHSSEDGSKCTSQTNVTFNIFQYEVCTNVGILSNGLMQEPNCQTVTDLCRRTFYDVITSEKFAQLCHLLLKSFPGMKVENVLDISAINSRMKEGAYENSPNLFISDVQQIWTKIQGIGMDMVALAKTLSDKARTSFCEQVGSVSHCSAEVGKHGFFRQASDTCGLYTVCSCKHCGENADGKYCLVCDSCEEMYHVSCIEPAVKEIPPKSWYCASCTAKGIGSPHENCVVCERMNAPNSSDHEGAAPELKNEETVMELEESSNDMAADELQLKDGETTLTCVVCRSIVENGERFKICRHGFCLHKFYHVRCLTSEELKTYGPCWYCPSCLCRGCLADRDDDKIVLCDGCDHAYHIYCMQPPRTSIPKGKWFCRKCDAEICRIRNAKRTYESMHQKLKKIGAGVKGSQNGELKEKGADALCKSGGVEMLLSAAKTLNYEDDMAALVMKS